MYSLATLYHCKCRSDMVICDALSPKKGKGRQDGTTSGACSRRVGVDARHAAVISMPASILNGYLLVFNIFLSSAAELGTERWQCIIARLKWGSEEMKFPWLLFPIRAGYTPTLWCYNDPTWKWVHRKEQKMHTIVILVMCSVMVWIRILDTHTRQKQQQQQKKHITDAFWVLLIWIDPHCTYNYCASY